MFDNISGKIMGKNKKGNQQKSKNVFQVAGNRVQRIKSKAQKVNLNLKNVSSFDLGERNKFFIY